jgi:hypothetical protein
MSGFPLCSDCFRDQGLKLLAEQFGEADDSACSNCGATKGQKLGKKAIANLAHRFFVWGTLHRCDYGAAPRVQFNSHQSTCIDTSPWFEPDLRLIEKAVGVGFFYYGPRMWMVGEVEPLKALLEPKTGSSIVDRILSEYSTKSLATDDLFYRIRIAPEKPSEFSEYDSPPIGVIGEGRSDSSSFSVMYGSQDLPVCIHECRVTAEDEIFVGTLVPTKTPETLGPVRSSH